MTNTIMKLVDAYAEAREKCEHILTYYAQSEFQQAEAKKLPKQAREELIAAITQQADQGWQPIETAPKSNPIKPEHRLIFWLDGIGPAFGYAYDDGAGGLLTVIDGYSGGRWEPTHWKPMLAAPKVVK